MVDDPKKAALERISKILGLVSAAAAIAGAALYVVGFLTVAPILQNAGVPLAAIPHTLYIGAGVLFAILTAVPALLGIDVALADTWQRALTTLAFSLALLLALAHLNASAGGFALGVLRFQGVVFVLAVGMTRAAVFIRTRTSRRRVFVDFATAAMILFLIPIASTAFGLQVYGTVRPILGGGHPRPVQITITPEGARELGNTIVPLLACEPAPAKCDVYEVLSTADYRYLAVGPRAEPFPGRDAGFLAYLKALWRRAPIDLQAVSFFSIKSEYVAAVQYAPVRR